MLYDLAVCVGSTNALKYCDVYFVDNIMLVQNIKINASVLSLYDQPTKGADFVVSGETQQHKLDGPRFVPIACNLFEGISLIGKEVSDKTNFSMTITSYSRSE